MTSRRPAVLTVALVLGVPAASLAHSGPPYPAVTGRVVGTDIAAVWTDPDTTDDGSAGGKFWITLEPADDRTASDSDARVRVTIEPRDRKDQADSVAAELIRRDPVTFYAALPMDHEGPFAVRVSLERDAGPAAEIECEVQATYDLRPSPALLILYAMPFLLVAGLWGKLILARRRARRPAV